jgi:hypothetical protein
MSVTPTQMEVLKRLARFIRRSKQRDESWPWDPPEVFEYPSLEEAIDALLLELEEVRRERDALKEHLRNLRERGGLV